MHGISTIKLRSITSRVSHWPLAFRNRTHSVSVTLAVLETHSLPSLPVTVLSAD